MRRVEIVIHTELDPSRLADFPASIRATLDVWADQGLIGDTAAWAVYETEWAACHHLATFEL